MSVCPHCQATYDDDLRYCGKCGSDMTLPPPGANDAALAEDPWLGRVVDGRYRVLAKIGQGGMGAVYKIEHVRMGKLAAMKILRAELTGDREALKRFKREAEAVSRLSHPNTVQVFDFGQWESSFYIVMELLRGEDLGRLVKRDGALPPARAARLLIQVCDALAEAHELGIVHRDLKPENLVLQQTRDGKDAVKVLDFGLAKVREREDLAEVTGRGAIIGTPYYMSPEQIRAEALDQRTDIYSLGAVAYRLVTGELPFQAQTPIGVLTKHLMDVPVAPTQRRPQLAEDPLGVRLDGVILKALAKKREERHQSSEALREALEGALVEHATPSGPGRAVTAHPVDERTGPLPAAAQTSAASTRAERLRREDFDAFERRLRLGRWIRLAILPVLLAAGLVAAYLVKVRLTSLPDFEIEPNDHPADATPLGQDHPVRGTMGKRETFDRSDVDFYHFTIPAGAPTQVLSVSVTGIEGIDLVLEVWNSSRKIAYADENGDALGEVIPDLGIGPGDYYVCVREVLIPGKAAVADTDDTYTLTARWHARRPTEEMEPDDTPRTALAVPLGVPFTGFLGRRNDVDYYLPQRPAGMQGGTLQGSVSGIPGVDMRVLVLTDAATHVLTDAATHPAASQPASGALVFDRAGIGASESFSGIPWPAGSPAPLVVVERKDPRPSASGKTNAAAGLDVPYTLTLELKPDR